MAPLHETPLYVFTRFTLIDSLRSHHYVVHHAAPSPDSTYTSLASKS